MVARVCENLVGVFYQFAKINDKKMVMYIISRDLYFAAIITVSDTVQL